MNQFQRMCCDTYIGLNEEDDELESVHISEATRRKKNADAAKKKPLYDVYLYVGAYYTKMCVYFLVI